MIFYLGTHLPHWLTDPRFDAIPLFISRRRLAGYAELPSAHTDFALDSGSFTELQMHGMWTMTADAYAEEIRHYARVYGKRLRWVAPQDWMCEPIVITGGRVGRVTFEGTGLSVYEHQRRTVSNFVRLRKQLGALVVPVLQGWQLEDYQRCQEMYERAGVHLADEETVGLGSVCRRQSTTWATKIVSALAADGLRLHGFGFKKVGVAHCQEQLVSADSMAWGVAAGREPPLAGHTHKHCSNCAEYALRWRAQLLAGLCSPLRCSPSTGDTARMAKKKKKTGKSRAHKKSRKPAKKKTRAKHKKVKRGCGKGNWSHGGNAYWKCKTGKRRPYKTKAKKR